MQLTQYYRQSESTEQLTSFQWHFVLHIVIKLQIVE